MTAKQISKLKTLVLLQKLTDEIQVLEFIWIRHGELNMTRFAAKDCVRMIRELRERGLFV